MELHQRIVSAPVDLGPIRSEFGLASADPAEATAEARDAIDAFAGDRDDRTDIPFVTIDPSGAVDLDQALHLERTPTGCTVHYAIADVGRDHCVRCRSPRSPEDRASAQLACGWDNAAAVAG